jgi:dTDP-4-amino-4,6-dideoxygalactose transaminase
MGIDIIDRIFRERGSGAERFPSRTGCSPVFAFLGIEQLKAADAAKESRKKLGAFLYEGLRDMRNIRIPFLLKDADNVFSSCPILVKEKDRIKKRLLRRGVDVSAGYLRYFPESGCFHAAGIEKEVLYLPLYPGLTAGEAAYITNTIKHVCA